MRTARASRSRPRRRRSRDRRAQSPRPRDNPGTGARNRARRGPAAHCARGRPRSPTKCSAHIAFSFVLVRPAGVEPAASALSQQRSPAELRTRIGASPVNRTRSSRCVRPTPSHLARDAWCAMRDSNPHCPEPESGASCQIGLIARMVPAERLELPTIALQERCTPAVLRRHENWQNENSQTGGRQPPNRNSTLPETSKTPHRRGPLPVSGLPYVQGRPILSNSSHVTQQLAAGDRSPGTSCGCHRGIVCGHRPRRSRSARARGSQRRARPERRKSPRLHGSRVLWCWCWCGPLCPPPVRQREDSRCLLRSCYPEARSFTGFRIIRTLNRAHLRPAADRVKPAVAGGGGDM